MAKEKEKPKKQKKPSMYFNIEVGNETPGLKRQNRSSITAKKPCGKRKTKNSFK